MFSSAKFNRQRAELRTPTRSRTGVKVPLTQGQLVKAKLLPATGESASPIEFQFNPESLSFSYGVELNTNTQGRTKTNVKKVSFAGPRPIKLTISNITFDTYEAGTSVKTEYIDPLIQSVKVVPKLKTKMVRSPITGALTQKTVQGPPRPPIYFLTWGDTRYLRCFVESLSYKLTMFLPDGTPVRAVANLSLKQLEEDGIGKKSKKG
jgi:hypothetical protein